MQKPMIKSICRLQLIAATVFALITIQFSTVSAQSIWEGGSIENGQSLFNANCASCHKVTDEVLAAPGLAGVSDRWGTSDEMLLMWIQNPQEAAESGDPYIKSLVERYVGTYGWMTGQAVSADDVTDIMAYVANPPNIEVAIDNSEACPTVDNDVEEATDKSSMLWFLVLFVLFLIIALSASGVRRSLTDLLAEKEGEEHLPDSSYVQRLKLWVWNNLVFVSLIGVFFLAYGVTIGYQALMGIGVYEGYSPDQPIKFIHSVHVCENEIDCKYCHNSAYDSKHAGIPSTNVCMNCHKAVKKGKRTGEEEIAKIYDAIGFDPATGTYMDGEGNNGHPLPQLSYEAEPIKWNKVHNLPDHVFFSHQQHVTVGGLQCQNCHGDVATYSVGRIAPVEEINTLVDQFPGLIQLSKPTLTMGWCVECHNKAEIDVASSGYYNEMHDRLKHSLRGNEELRRYLEDDKITVRELGGWECSKCHY
jgi:mono/diheme cytochrome c family protein